MARIDRPTIFTNSFSLNFPDIIRASSTGPHRSYAMVASCSLFRLSFVLPAHPYFTKFLACCFLALAFQCSFIFSGSRFLYASNAFLHFSRCSLFQAFLYSDPFSPIKDTKGCEQTDPPTILGSSTSGFTLFPPAVGDRGRSRK